MQLASTALSPVYIHDGRLVRVAGVVVVVVVMVVWGWGGGLGDRCLLIGNQSSKCFIMSSLKLSDSRCAMCVCS